MPNMTVKQFIKKYFKKLFIGLHEMKKKTWEIDWFRDAVLRTFIT